MKFTIAPAAAAGCPDAVVRFLPAGAPVTFSDPSLQRAYAALFQGDGLTAAHKQLRTLRLPLNGGFTTLLLMGFDSGAASPFDDFRAALASLGAALNRLEACTVLLDRLDSVTFAGEAQLLEQVACTLPLSEYKFDLYLSEKSPSAAAR